MIGPKDRNGPGNNVSPRIVTYAARAKQEKMPGPQMNKRAGIIAFVFFLGKGLVWLGLAAAGAYYTLN